MFIKGVLKKVPLPETFFSIKHHKSIAPVKILAASSAFIYAVSTIVFLYYCSMFSNDSIETSVLSDDWQLTGYECRPIRKDQLYEVHWTYSECLQNYRAPSPSSLFSLYREHKRTWIYEPLKVNLYRRCQTIGMCKNRRYASPEKF